MIKILLIAGILMFCLSSCSEKSNNTQDKPEQSCNQLENDSLITLKGILNISSKGNFVFADIKKRGEWQRKIHLIPCSEHLNKYVWNSYDSYLYLKNFDDQFWVSVEGKYISSDTLDEPPKFLFNFISLTDELEAITDSSHASRKITNRQKTRKNKINDIYSKTRNAVYYHDGILKDTDPETFEIILNSEEPKAKDKYKEYKVSDLMKIYEGEHH
jgi:hypothetical protein